MRIRMAPLESEALLSAVAKGSVGEHLTPEENAAINARIGGNFVYLENVHYQYTEGFLSEESWQTNRAEIRGLMRTFSDVRTMTLQIDCATSVWRESFCLELKSAAEQILAEM